MNRLRVVLAAVALTVFLAGAVGTASAATPGSATYRIQTSGQGSAFSMTVNETIASTSNPSYQDLIVKVAAGGSTFNFSRSVNSSDAISPFLPAVSNQTFGYSSAKGSLTVSLVKNGTESLQFQGAARTLTSYSLSGAASANGSSVTFEGALAAFQSGLVYSAALHLSFTIQPASISQGALAGLNASALPGTSSTQGPVTGSETVQVTLLSTNLPLDAGSSSPAAQAASVGVGAGAVVTALAVGLGVRRHNKHSETVPEAKPEHWVD
ncbi:MAG: hypothetical protein JRN09_03600 [Nitrososphaerota archaeon]|nr:hypothetical protein [Nitrososphaerota archaeon]